MTVPDPTWLRLKGMLRHLAVDRHRPLRSFPDPSVDQGRSPPFRVGLAAWAVDQAAALHARLGDGIVLTVGTLDYPSRRRTYPDGSPRPAPPRADEPLLDPNLLTVGPEAPLEVASGHSLRATLLCSNRGTEPLGLATNGVVLCTVVDPAGRGVVGLHDGPLTLARVVHHLEPARTTRVPMLAGTASTVPDLGYAVPPGRWALEAVVALEGRGRFRTPLLPLLVTL